MTALQRNVSSQSLRTSLGEELKLNSSRCIQCGRCVAECRFLKNNGDPKSIADGYDPGDKHSLGLPFECSLCGLCTAVCPVDLDPMQMFLEMRRETFERGEGEYPEHSGVRAYEKRGTSRRYSWYALPEECDTVFFPGCGLPGTRPEQTLKTFAHLRRSISNIGIVLDCCTKPSHDLGREQYFQEMFGEMKDYLAANGIKTVLVACPNCYKVFSQYAPELETRTIYEVLDEKGLPKTPTVGGTVTVHDSCVARFAEPVQNSVRSLLSRKGLTPVDPPHSRKTTLCCGEGGAVGCVSPDLAKGWTRQRMQEAEGQRTVTYCTGCAHFLGAHGPTSHILDLVLTPEDAMVDKAKVAKAPFTYLNRLRVKKTLRKTFPSATTRERTFTAGEESRAGLLKKLGILALIIALILAVRASGATEYLEQERLRDLIQGYGVWAPIIYMSIYTVAPALFLPGLPLTIAAGVLFGPFWGVVYSIISATLGACVAFLVSRYLARGWIENKLKSPRWRHLDEQVEKHGWKMVAFTRLIPLFPFNLLNYAFGLTRIKFTHYALATFLFMLPGCIAFITFSSSLLDVIRGRISPTFLVGLALVIGVSLLPLLIRRYQARREKEGQVSSREEELDEGAGSHGQYRLGKSLRLKSMILLALLFAAGLGVYLGDKYFWAINSYIYTAEFHLMFLLNNLMAGDLEMFTEYFRPMGASPMALFLLLLGHLFQGFWFPLSKPVLVSAQAAAQGVFLGGVFSYLSLFQAGILSFALGRFLLGDILPVLRKGQGEAPPAVNSTAVGLLMPAIMALPWLPLPVAPLLGGLLRLSATRMIWLMLPGLALRVLWLLAMPHLFH